MAKVGRNEPCPCGSGKKYKKCCLTKDEETKRSRLEALEKKRLEAEREAEQDEELFEDALEDEDVEDEEVEDEPGEESVDEADEAEADEEEADEEEADEEEADEEEELRPPEKVVAEVPEISDEEERIVAKWREEYKKMSGIEEIRRHIEDFLRDHPKLVPNLELHHGVLSDLGAACVEAGRHAEYIDLLLKMRGRFADSYIKSFGYYDRDIISYKIASGRKDEVADFLGFFKEYPEEDPDNLFKTVRVMMASNCQEMVADFVQDVYYDVSTSPRIFGGDELVDILVMAYMVPFLKPDFTDADMEALASKLKTVRVPLNDEWYRPDFLRSYFGMILNSREKWDIDDCKTRGKVIERYHEVGLNFMGFLHEHKGKDWLAADFYRAMIFRYLNKVVPAGKRPKQMFIFSKAKIDKTVAKMCSSFFFQDCTCTIISLNSVYWFAEYLEGTGSITEEQRTAIQRWCAELYDETFPYLSRTVLLAKAFEKFPV